MFFKKINSVIHETNLLDFALYFAVATIPFHNNLNSWSIVIFCVIAFFQAPPWKIPFIIIRSRFWILSTAYFLWLGASYFWDTTGGFVFRDLERYGGFVIFPFVLTIISKISLRVIFRACMIFVLVVSIISIICLIKSYLEYRAQGDYRVFAYHYLSMQMDLNAVILSNYCLESLVWLLFFPSMAAGNDTRPGKVLTWSCGVLLCFMIFLLSSKLIIFLLVLLMGGAIIYQGVRKRRMIMSVLLVIVFLAAGIGLVSQLPYLRWRIAKTEFRQYNDERDNQNGLGARLLMWNSGIELIRERPVLGYGILGAKQELFKKYRDKNFELGIERHYNVHNQFIETTLSSGFIGLFLLLTVLVSMGANSFRERKFLLGFILFHFLCMSMVESTLDVQQELVFFMFFSFLFYYHLPGNRMMLREEVVKKAGLRE